MEKRLIELGDRDFMSNMSFEKLDSMKENIFPDCEDVTLSDIWLDYGEMGNVAVYDVKRKGCIKRYVYGQFGRIELGHMDINTWKYIDPCYVWPSTNIDYSWFLNMAIYNRKYVKHGRIYLKYVEDVLLTELSNKKEFSQEDTISKKKLINHIRNVFTQISKSYNEIVNTLEDSILPGEEQKVNNILIISSQPDYEI